MVQHLGILCRTLIRISTPVKKYLKWSDAYLNKKQKEIELKTRPIQVLYLNYR